MKKYDIVLVDFGISKGSVQGGLRPAIIVSNDFGNKYSTTLIVVPTTSKEKTKIPTHFYIQLGVRTTVLCEQIQSISKEQVRFLITEHTLSKIDRQILDMKLKTSLALPNI